MPNACDDSVSGKRMEEYLSFWSTNTFFSICHVYLLIWTVGLLLSRNFPQVNIQIYCLFCFELRWFRTWAVTVWLWIWRALQMEDRAELLHASALFPGSLESIESFRISLYFQWYFLSCFSKYHYTQGLCIGCLRVSTNIPSNNHIQVFILQIIFKLLEIICLLMLLIGSFDSFRMKSNNWFIQDLQIRTMNASISSAISPSSPWYPLLFLGFAMPCHAHFPQICGFTDDISFCCPFFLW